jgi:hypothetical protein
MSTTVTLVNDGGAPAKYSVPEGEDLVARWHIPRWALLLHALTGIGFELRVGRNRLEISAFQGRLVWAPGRTP